MLEQRFGHILVPIGKRLLVCGGAQDCALDGLYKTILDAAEWFDPPRGLWTRAAPMLSQRVHHAGAAINGALYICGGMNMSCGGEFQPLRSAERYEPALGAWAELPAMHSPRGAHAAVASSGQLYIFGGAPNKILVGKNYPDELRLRSAESFGPSTNSWEQMPQMASSRVMVCACALPA